MKVITSTTRHKTGIGWIKKVSWLGGSPYLVVMGGDSFSKGWGFESHQSILDGRFFTFFVVKIVLFVSKDKNKLKRGMGWSIFLKKKVSWERQRKRQRNSWGSNPIVGKLLYRKFVYCQLAHFLKKRKRQTTPSNGPPRLLICHQRAVHKSKIS